MPCRTDGDDEDIAGDEDVNQAYSFETSIVWRLALFALNLQHYAGKAVAQYVLLVVSATRDIIRNSRLIGKRSPRSTRLLSAVARCPSW
jgi:hypothetical protein